MHLQRYCQLIMNCFCIKPLEFNSEDMNVQIRQWFGTVGWFVQLIGGCFRLESDYPTFFYHLAVLDYKPSYSQETWLLHKQQFPSAWTINQLVYLCDTISKSLDVGKEIPMYFSMLPKYGIKAYFSSFGKLVLRVTS